MPKKPPFNHFRKSCRSPSNSNKKEKSNYRCHLFPARDVPACPTGGCVGKGSRGSRRSVPAGPASSTSPSRPFPESRHLHVALEQLPVAKDASRGTPPMPRHTSRDARSPYPYTPEGPIGWAHKEHSVPFCIQHPVELCFCSLGMPWSLQGGAVGRAAAQLHQGSVMGNGERACLQTVP